MGLVGAKDGRGREGIALPRKACGQGVFYQTVPSGGVKIGNIGAAKKEPPPADFAGGGQACKKL
jgi:hypothetical protein